MVYYQPPKRDLQRRRNEVLTMIHLPDELILDCMDHLATLDVLHLRLTHSGLAPAGNTALQQRLKRLYIHPSDLSLLTAVKICAHPMFSQEIQEVVLLGTIEHSKVNEEIEIFWPWPRTFPKPRDQPSTAVLTQSANGTFSDIYRPLMDGLSSLPNVRKLSYAKRVKSPGFNQTRAETIRSHVQRPLNGRWNDWQVMTELIDKLSPTSLRLSIPLQIVTSIDRSPRVENMARLGHLTLTLFPSSNDQHYVRRWTDMCENLSRRSENLTRLEITLIGAKPCPHIKVETHLARIMACRWRNLTHLALISRREPIFTRTQPPILQGLLSEDLSRFVVDHANKLATVRIENILFLETNQSVGQPTALSTVENMRDVVTTLRRNECNVVYRINQYHHHEWCGKRSGRWKRCQPQVCGLYTPYDENGAHLTRQDLEEFAERVGVATETGGESWDFGGMVLQEVDE
ncbi:unnamed protein product [Zymoseptoria tritici ST99CH_3D1]|nr:unnamed protein product [Zymoseptoria tritici ST99CH_3D1]